MLATSVWARSPTRFDLSGQRLPPDLHPATQGIRPGLAKRLQAYAHKELFAQGFGALAKEATVEVYTIDGDSPPADRTYCVRWQTPQGGYVELGGILTKSGWPSLHHGFDIGVNEKP